MEKFLSKALIKLRKDNNLTQSEFGKILGMSRSKVSSWEIGRRDLSIIDAVIICDYFGISLDCLVNPGKINTKKVIEVLNQCIINFAELEEEKVELFKAIDEIINREVVI